MFVSISSMHLFSHVAVLVVHVSDVFFEMRFFYNGARLFVFVFSFIYIHVCICILIGVGFVWLAARWAYDELYESIFTWRFAVLCGLCL